LNIFIKQLSKLIENRSGGLKLLVYRFSARYS